MRVWINDNLCYLTIKCDTGQHSQFLRCFDTEYKIAVNETTLEGDHFRKEKLRTMEQTAAYERLKAVIPIHPADSTKYLFMMFLFS